VCTEVQEQVRKGTSLAKTEPGIRNLIVARYDVEMNRLQRTRDAHTVLRSEGFTEVYRPTRFSNIVCDYRVKSAIANAESRELQIKVAAEAEIKRAFEKRELDFKLKDDARDLRLQQAADAAAVRRFNLHSHLAKQNTARHYFAGATNPSRASMHPKVKGFYDCNNNYIFYKGFVVHSNIVDKNNSSKTNIPFNDEGEKEDPFIHKSAPGGEEPPSEEGSPNIPGGGDNNYFVKKLMGFLSHLVPHWMDINSPFGKFLLLLFVIIGLILTMLGIRYLYYKFIKPLFNKNSKDSNKLKRKKDNNL
jgi:hypothetical protein